MGDSDEEYDRRSRGRDKFRRERNDYQERNAGNRRDDWQESREGGGSGGWGNQSRDRIPQRRDYRDNYGNAGQRRDRYSPADRSDMSPPMKRTRGGRDWDDRGYPNYEMGGYGMASHNANWNMDNGPNQSNMGSNHHREGDGGPTQPPMMTFKQYMASLDDNIDDHIAVKKYNDYKLDFKKQQILNFFNAHKDEEWFRSKYHPEEYEKRKTEQSAALKKRLNVFLDLFKSGWIDSVSIDIEKANQITRLLDAAVIKLEGGTDFDLKALDENYDEERTKEPDLSLFSVDIEKPVEVKPKEENGEESLDSGTGIDNEVNVKSEDTTDEKEGEEVSEVNKAEEVTNNADLEEGEEQSLDANIEIKAEDKPFESEENVTLKDSSDKANDDKETDKPRPLHKTTSIFLRNIAPSITKQEIEELCTRFEGFIRVCIADPTSDRRFYRRGWATYERNVKIREICWAMNSIKLRDCELGPIVNRDLTRRIRSVNGIASHKNVVRADIRHAAKIIFNLDKQRKLWEDESSEEKSESSDKPMFGFESRNPLLKNITDYLIEEASAEEEELLGTSEIGELEEREEGENANPSLDRDENLIKVLDRLLIYLRIVHSVDYYNHTDYPNEDEMPNRIGIMHARGMHSTSSRVTQQEINEFIKNFETKVQPFIVPPSVITEEEALKLGSKDAEEEAERFIKENTQELSKDKWLCPLSGKKFKGPDFVRKHILNKHSGSVEEAKKNAEYLNNYIIDPKRPQLPEHPSNRQSNASTRDGIGMGMGGHMGPGGPYPPPPYMQGGYGPRPMMMPMMGAYMPRYPPMGMGGPMHEYGRAPMHHQKPRYPNARKRNYCDLDAPVEDIN